MLKRTKGRLLLTLLVITGLAGTLTDNSLDSKERKFAVNHLKETKNDLLKSVKGLSETQLNFKSSPDRWSIKECFYHIILTENGLWRMFEATMKEPTTPEKRADIKVSDGEVVKMITDRTQKRTAAEPFLPGKASWNSFAEAMDAFKQSRATHLKYTKTTTEDLRNHVFAMPFGSIDAYQFILFMSAHSSRHTQQIKEIKANPNFPRQ